ncbi:MAG: preprotein translocase subunit SecG [Rhodospirillaceae bacterium]|jgi:preprotein translocase subunit SecG|nr:preprotein translocase subunit SecG [Rhodospirillaceae bacterium]MBT5299268.1 preprotein translocase subunit SecG [Rhodospirillaceae bacterium]MBT6085774.1 preprotein translocase subunit SecG [Rhodospirillaceae bacterium]MBT6608070.1 preprotein translocase subunit SecG [Rhodospirillaceae bacterium]MBT7248808.1 preprotein translocase subunit SecG [Rhodospirillaceae bacterium]
METVILIIHLLIALAMVGAILLQKSEGGALGMGGSGGGGGGGMGGFMSGRQAGDLLTRTTAILATCFFITSFVLAILGGAGRESTSILDAAPAPSTIPTAPTEPAAPVSK